MIINGYEQYSELKSRMGREPHIHTPIYRDFYCHPAANEVLCVGITFMNGETFTVSVSHNDAKTFEEPLSEFCFSHTARQKTHIDLRMVGYLNNESVPDIGEYFTPYVLDTHNTFQEYTNINSVIPIMVWHNILYRFNNDLLPFVRSYEKLAGTRGATFYTNALTVLRDIENAGIAVDASILEEYFGPRVKRYIRNGKIYSQYNPFTVTGRPSNRFGGINFAALNKSDGSRKAFVSRFPNGKLMLIDYEAYHLRLLGDYIGMLLPTKSIHEYLAKIYFNKDSITKEEYEEGKQETFKILYGENVDTNIKILKDIKNLSSILYRDYIKHGYTVAPYSHRHITLNDFDITENKVFNYFTQCLEFEFTINKLKLLQEKLSTRKAELVLYTYDSVLIDCPEDEIETVSYDAYAALIGGNFLLRFYIGSNYNDLTFFE